MNIKTLASLMNKILKFCSFMRSKFSRLIHVIRNVASYFLDLESWCEKNNMVKKWYISERLRLESLIVFWHCSYWYCGKFSLYLMKGVRLLLLVDQGRTAALFLQECWNGGSPDHGRSYWQTSKAIFIMLKTSTSRFGRASTLDLAWWTTTSVSSSFIALNKFPSLSFKKSFLVFTITFFFFSFLMSVYNT